MVNNRSPTVFGVLIVVAAMAAPAKAAESPPNSGSQREFGAKLEVCDACHGGKGVPRDEATPIIWGQQENYLLKRLNDFQSGDQDTEVMSWMAKTLSRAELGDASAYFAKKDWPARSAEAASLSPPDGIAVCQICHQQHFVGGLSAPRLAGQPYEYLVEAMRRFAEGERTKIFLMPAFTDMKKMMEALSPTERQAIARYISGL
jgi:cytochrome c553